MLVELYLYAHSVYDGLEVRVVNPSVPLKCVFVKGGGGGRVYV